MNQEKPVPESCVYHNVLNDDLVVVRAEVELRRTAAHAVQQQPPEARIACGVAYGREGGGDDPAGAGFQS